MLSLISCTLNKWRRASLGEIGNLNSKESILYRERKKKPSVENDVGYGSQLLLCWCFEVFFFMASEPFGIRLRKFPMLVLSLGDIVRDSVESCNSENLLLKQKTYTIQMWVMSIGY